MGKVKAWEKIPKDTKDIANGYILRIGDSQYGIDVYQYGFVVGRIQGKKRFGIGTDHATYPSDVAGLVSAVRRLGSSIDGKVAGVEEAIQGHIRANKYAAEISERIDGLFQDAA